MKISNFSESDEGVYTCIASNVLGRANSTIRLYGKLLSEDWTFVGAHWTWNGSMNQFASNLIFINYCVVKSFSLSLSSHFIFNLNIVNHPE